MTRIPDVPDVPEEELKQYYANYRLQHSYECGGTKLLATSDDHARELLSEMIATAADCNRAIADVSLFCKSSADCALEELPFDSPKHIPPAQSVRSAQLTTKGGSNG